MARHPHKPALFGKYTESRLLEGQLRELRVKPGGAAAAIDARDEQLGDPRGGAAAALDGGERRHGLSPRVMRRERARRSMPRPPLEGPHHQTRLSPARWGRRDAYGSVVSRLRRSGRARRLRRNGGAQRPRDDRSRLARPARVLGCGGRPRRAGKCRATSANYRANDGSAALCAAAQLPGSCDGRRSGEQPARLLVDFVVTGIERRLAGSDDLLASVTTLWLHGTITW